MALVALKRKHQFQNYWIALTASSLTESKSSCQDICMTQAYLFCNSCPSHHTTRRKFGRPRTPRNRCCPGRHRCPCHLRHHACLLVSGPKPALATAQICQLCQIYLSAPNMVKWYIPRKILQNAVQ